MPSASASSHACNGPAPPNATSAQERGSTPRATVTVRTACSIAAFTTVTTPAGKALLQESVPLVLKELMPKSAAFEVEARRQAKRRLVGIFMVND